MSEKKTTLFLYFGFQIQVLLDNLSFPFTSTFRSSSHQVTESLCQDFHGTISINCGQFYSVGWHCLTLLTTNCSASNAVWGPPAWNPAERMGGWKCRWKGSFLSCCEIPHATAWLALQINRFFTFTGEMWEIVCAVSRNYKKKKKRKQLLAQGHQLSLVWSRFKIQKLFSWWKD